MMTVKVWLLVMVGSLNGGELGAVAPHKFASITDCQRVAAAGLGASYPMTGGHGARDARWRCVETTVLVKE